MMVKSGKDVPRSYIILQQIESDNIRRRRERIQQVNYVRIDGFFLLKLLNIPRD